MDYIGSKKKLNSWIFGVILNYQSSDRGVFLDACAGSGAVSLEACRRGFEVISSDILCLSSVVIEGQISIGGEVIAQGSSIIDNINYSAGIEGFFYNNYSPASIPPRMFFTEENAKKIDFARKQIKNFNQGPLKSYLLWRLVEAVSSVSNTVGVQAAFLKKFKSRALNPLTIVPIKEDNRLEGPKITTYTGNFLNILGSGEDIVYFDPPYNQRQYAPNYHIFETIAREDFPEVSGVSGLRPWKEESKSNLCTKQGLRETIEYLFAKTTATRVFMSYSTDGLLSEGKIYCLLSNYGDVIVYRRPQKRFRSASKSTQRKLNSSPLEELLFVVSV